MLKILIYGFSKMYTKSKFLSITILTLKSKAFYLDTILLRTKNKFNSFTSRDNEHFKGYNNYRLQNKFTEGRAQYHVRLVFYQLSKTDILKFTFVTESTKRGKVPLGSALKRLRSSCEESTTRKSGRESKTSALGGK
jgi:hypothetical protein